MSDSREDVGAAPHAALGVVGEVTSDAPFADVSTAGAPTAEAPTAEAPTAGAPTAEAPFVEAPGGPKRTAKGPRAVRGPGTGLVASLALVVLLVVVIGWTRC